MLNLRTVLAIKRAVWDLSSEAWLYIFGIGLGLGLGLGTRAIGLGL